MDCPWRPSGRPLPTVFAAIFNRCWTRSVLGKPPESRRRGEIDGLMPRAIPGPSMNLYLDDDSAKASLVKLLRKAGHRVAIPADAGLAGASDPRHLRRTVQSGAVH